MDWGADALMVAKELARVENTSLGKVVARLIRRVLTGEEVGGATGLNAQAGPPGAGGCAPGASFLSDDYSLLEAGALQWPHVLGLRQITDAYLLGLAVRHGCRFVSFDARVDRATVVGAGAEHLVVL